MDLLKGLKCEMPCLKSGAAALVAGVGGLLSMIVMIACGNFYIYKLLLMPRHAPPALLFFFTVLLFSSLHGYTLGLIYCYGKKGRIPNALLFGILTLVFYFLWYISFFRTAALLFALFMLVMALLLGVMTVRECLQIGIVPSVMAGCSGAFLLYFLWLTFSAVILN